MTAIAVEGLVKRYGATVAADGIDLRVAAGEVHGIVGPNGSGKTTTVEMIAGVRTPDAGDVRVLGLDPRRDRDRLRQVLGVQLQKAVLPDDITVAEAVGLYRSFYRTGADVGALLEELGLATKRDTRFQHLSGGQAQRLSVALALVGRPRVVLLDELTTGLDPRGRRDIWALVERLRGEGITVVLVTHFMEEARRLCDRLSVIDRGRVVATDTPDGLIARVDVGQRLRLRTDRPVPPGLLDDLPEVGAIDQHDDVLVVSGDGNLLHAVTSALLGLGIAATETRVESASLDDAYLALTGRAPEADDETDPDAEEAHR